MTEKDQFTTFPPLFSLLEDTCTVNIWKEDHHYHNLLRWISVECAQYYILGLNLLLRVSFWKASHSRALNGIYWSPLTGCLFLWGQNGWQPRISTIHPLLMIQSWQSRWESFHEHLCLRRWALKKRRGTFQKILLPVDLSRFIFLNQLLNQLDQSCCTSWCKLPLLCWTQITVAASHYLGEGPRSWESLPDWVLKTGEWTQKILDCRCIRNEIIHFYTQEKTRFDLVEEVQNRLFCSSVCWVMFVGVVPPEICFDMLRSAKVHVGF